MPLYSLKNDDPFLGRCLIANEDIPQAQIIIEEEPLGNDALNLTLKIT